MYVHSKNWAIYVILNDQANKNMYITTGTGVVEFWYVFGVRCVRLCFCNRLYYVFMICAAHNNIEPDDEVVVVILIQQSLHWIAICGVSSKDPVKWQSKGVHRVLRSAQLSATLLRNLSMKNFLVLQRELNQLVIVIHQLQDLLLCLLSAK